uniref:Uncharacterized protein n=1 Tax=Arundo donax TaxID=35708 RepID=A0A0A9EPA7_ARUDO
MRDLGCMDFVLARRSCTCAFGGASADG